MGGNVALEMFQESESDELECLASVNGIYCPIMCSLGSRTIRLKYGLALLRVSDELKFATWLYHIIIQSASIKVNDG
jgi:hypothetical protein